MNLVWLLAEVGGGGGDVAGGVAYRPDQRRARASTRIGCGDGGGARGLQSADAGSRGLQQGQRGEGDDH